MTAGCHTHTHTLQYIWIAASLKFHLSAKRCFLTGTRVIRLVAVGEETEHAQQAGPDSVSWLWQWFSILLQFWPDMLWTGKIRTFTPDVAERFEPARWAGSSTTLHCLKHYVYLTLSCCSSNCSVFHIEGKKMVMAWCSTVDRKRSRDYWRRSGLDGQPFSPASQSAKSSQCVTVCLWLTVCITHLSPFCLSIFVLHICIDFACFSFCS